MLTFHSPQAAQALLMLQQIRQLEGASPILLERLQNKQISLLLQHAYRYSNFWHLRLNAIGFDVHSPEKTSLPLIPPLTRSELQGCFKELRARWSGLDPSKIGLVTSSGSTGSPVRVEKALSIHEPLGNAFELMNLTWHGINPHKNIAVIGYFSEDASLSSWGGIYKALGYRGRFEKRRIGNYSPAEHLSWLYAVRPTYLMASPFLVAEMSRLALEAGRPLPFSIILSKAERVSPHQRKLAKLAFGAKIIDRYSSQETGSIALQCSKHEHFHVLSPGIVVEIVDDSGRACLPGVPGRVLVTNLYSYAMPLIRYDLGDLAEWGSACDCGVSWPVIGRLWGRTRHQVVLPDGTAFPMGFLGDDLGLIPVVREFRVRQFSDRVLELQLVVERTLVNDEVDFIRMVLQKCGLSGLPLCIRYVPKIDWVSGKKREEFEVVNAAYPDWGWQGLNFVI